MQNPHAPCTVVPMKCLLPNVRHWCVEGDDLVIATTSTDHEPIELVLERLPLPAFLRQEVPIVEAAAQLACPVRVEWVKDLGGAVGLYVPSRPALVVLGSRDISVLTDRIVATYFRRLTPGVGQHRASRGEPVLPVAEFARFVTTRVLRHEYGHALRFGQGTWTPYHHEEAAADYLAGWLDSGARVDHRLTDSWIAERVFHTAGCVGWECTHPAPETRVEAYALGLRHARAVVA